MDKFLKALRRWAVKLKNIPLLGALADDLVTLLDLLRDCFRGLYPKLPRGLMIGTVIILGYALSPIDLLPDLIPLLGFLDDAAVLALLLEFCVAGDLLRYRAWREGLREKGLDALRENLIREILSILGENRLAAAFLTEEKKIRLLICPPEEKEAPLRCRSVLLTPPLEQLENLGVEDWEQLGSFFTRVFQSGEIPWSSLGPRPFSPEYDGQTNTDDFIIEGKKAIHGSQ